MNNIILLICFTIPVAVSWQEAAVKNLRVYEEYGGLKISWDAPASTQAVLYYSIDYKTTGYWIPLKHRTSKTSYYWFDYPKRPGTTYHFRVYGDDPAYALTSSYVLPRESHKRPMMEMASGSREQHFFNVGTTILSLFAAKFLM